MHSPASRPRGILCYGWLIVPLCFALGSLALNWGLDFQQYHNDFWDTVFYARHLHWADRQSWFNPQYPVGCGLLLKLILGDGNPAGPAILVNVAFGTLTLAVSGWLFRKILPPGFALLSLVSLSLFVQFFHYMNAGGGDPAALFFFTAGIALIFSRLFDSPQAAPSRGFLAAGFLLGLGALFRYHVLVADGMLVLAIVVIRPQLWKTMATVSAGVFTVYSLQWAVNLASGHGLLETQFGPMNVYDLMYGINWHRTLDLKLPGSVGAIIAGDPALFLKKYLTALWSFKQAYGPPLIAALWVRHPQRKWMMRIVAAWEAIYFLMFSATTSGRQILLALPLSMLALGMVMLTAWEYRFDGNVLSHRRTAWVTWGAWTLVALMLGVNLLRDFRLLEKRSTLQRDFHAIEADLRDLGVRKATQVFTSDFDLYFRTLPDQIPYFNGGAPRWGTYLYNREFPEFPVDSMADFISACKRRGVRFVVLNPDAQKLSPLFEAIYTGKDKPSALPWQQNVFDYRIFAVE